MSEEEEYRKKFNVPDGHSVECTFIKSKGLLGSTDIFCCKELNENGEVVKQQKLTSHMDVKLPNTVRNTWEDC